MKQNMKQLTVTEIIARNLAGAGSHFHAAETGARLLETAPERSRKAGWAEAIKNALLSAPASVPRLRRAWRREGRRYTAAQLTDLARHSIESRWS